MRMRVYLDMCCYNRPYDDQLQLKVAMEAQSKLHIQNLIRDRKIELIGSYILDYEVSRNPYEMRKRSIIQFIYANMKGYVGAERDSIIRPMAEDIMKTGVKEKDAYHVASAIYSNCDYFISTDIRLLKYKTDKIRMVTPIEFITETEGEE
jgi:predicted nucleic acid-binding protein